MSIQAKFEGICRIIGSIAILITTFIFAWFYSIFFQCLPITLIIITLIIPWLIIIILRKLEIDLISNNFYDYLIFLIIYSLGLSIIGLYACLPRTYYIQYFTALISEILVCISWNYALSIKKMEKLIFVFCGTGVFILNLIYYLMNFGILIALFLFLSGFLLILIAEAIMKKKGMLKYL
ncbi:MAG: hypothetical protein ACTSVV_08775 [Promethearchaeota archaeon]